VSAQRVPRAALDPRTRLAMALVLPPALGIVFQGLGLYGLNAPLESTRVLLYLGIGAGAWSLALRSGPLAESGLRGFRVSGGGRRPMYFATLVGMLVALPLLVARLAFAPIAAIALPDADALRSAFFEILFAGLCGQLWLFGVLYNAVRDWPQGGDRSAVAVTGLLYGACYFQWLGLAQPSPDAGLVRLLYFLALGVTLALARWRSGSVLGLAIGWGLLVWITWDLAQAPQYAAGPDWLWGTAVAAQVVLGWLLWPRAHETSQAETKHG
jgi:hypothetical protein